MDFIKMLREDMGLLVSLSNVSDVEILPEFRTSENQDGDLTYNIPGKTFAESGSGGEYILLDDGSIGYWGSEGQCGRLAENLNEFFEFVVSCPFWQNYLREDAYQSRETLEAFAKEDYKRVVEETKGFGFDLPKAQQELFERLEIEKKTDITDILMRFYQCAKREPRFITTYTDYDGETHSGTGSLFDR